MSDEVNSEAVFAAPLPLLPLKDTVVFPRMVVPVLVGRPASLAAVEEALASGQPILLCAQVDPEVELPGKEDLHEVGVAANILQTLRMNDGTIKVVVEGLASGRLQRVHQRDAFLEATARAVESKPLSRKRNEALVRATVGLFEEYARLSQRVAPEIVMSLRNVTDGKVMADLVCAYLSIRFEERQELLNTVATGERLEKIIAILMRENEMFGLENEVRERVREQMERSQREYYLHEQLKAIRRELGDREDAPDEFTELREMIQGARMPKEVQERALRELDRYERMPSMSPEGAVIRTYIEWLIDMPWQKRTRDKIELDRAKEVLDNDHYGLAKVKERIIEFLAVRKLSKHSKGPILCFVGPPGVGKTSLGQSIARAMGRKFIRFSLGGIRDEAEIRGHRRTYVGALPGRVLQNIRKVGVKNPVFMLDEVDKMGADFRGDPASALLEVLDPEQNSRFADHYLEVDFDLHEVFFITTANNEFSIPPALLDRMETLHVPGYTSYEKERIARLFLIPKQMKECGLTGDHIRFAESAIYTLIERYTREAGVRELERRIAMTCRKVARKVVSKGLTRPIMVNEKRLPGLLGPFEYSQLRADEPKVGVSVGMAWTAAGGDILSIETSVMKGKGNLTLTGQLGDVMKESASAAYSYLRAHAEELKIPPNFHKTTDLHVHVPEGAIPKDGPSAGVPIAVSILSALTKTPPKILVALTGEITLRGRVLPVGGVKEKLLAAHRAGVRTVVLPKENEKDLVEIPKNVRSDFSFVFIEDVAQAFETAFDFA